MDEEWKYSLNANPELPLCSNQACHSKSCWCQFIETPNHAGINSLTLQIMPISMHWHSKSCWYWFIDTANHADVNLMKLQIMLVSIHWHSIWRPLVCSGCLVKQKRFWLSKKTNYSLNQQRADRIFDFFFNYLKWNWQSSTPCHCMMMQIPELEVVVPPEILLFESKHMPCCPGMPAGCLWTE